MWEFWPSAIDNTGLIAFCQEVVQFIIISMEWYEANMSISILNVKLLIVFVTIDN